MDNAQRKAEMIILQRLGLTEEEAIFAIRAATEFKWCRAEVCTYVVALVSQIVDMHEKKN